MTKSSTRGVGDMREKEREGEWEARGREPLRRNAFSLAEFLIDAIRMGIFGPANTISRSRDFDATAYTPVTHRPAFFFDTVLILYSF